MTEDFYKIKVATSFIESAQVQLSITMSHARKSDDISNKQLIALLQKLKESMDDLRNIERGLRHLFLNVNTNVYGLKHDAQFSCMPPKKE